MVVIVEYAFDPHDGIGSQQFHGGFDIVEADRPFLEHFQQDTGKLADVDFEAELQRLSGRQTRADAAQLLTKDGFVQFELPTSEDFAAEGIVTKDFASCLEHLARVFVDAVVEVESLLFDLNGGIGRNIPGYRRARRQQGEEGKEELDLEL